MCFRLLRAGLLLLLLSLPGLQPLAMGQPTDPEAAPAAAEADVKTGPPISELLLQLSTEDDDDARAALLARLARTREPDLVPVLEAYRLRALYRWQDQIVMTRDVEGSDEVRLVEPLTGELLGEAGEPVQVAEDQLTQLRPDRGDRKAASDAITLLSLYVRNVDDRLAAVKKVGDRRETPALATLDDIAQTDPVARVRRMARESALLLRASGDIEEQTADQQLMAAAQLGEMTSIRGRVLLQDLLRAIDAEGDPVATQRVEVYETAIARIQRHETFVAWMGHLFKGVSAGSILVLMALGLAITFGLMGVINMAHGEMMMIGAVTTWFVHEMFTAYVPVDWFNWYFVAAFPLAFIVAAAAGLLIELLVVRHLYRRPLDSLLATIGVSFILIQAVRMWKGDNLGMSSPTWLTGGLEVMQDVILPYNRLFIIALTAGCVGVVAGIMRFTKAGLMVRATMQNREMAQSLGVNTRIVDLVTFAFGAGIAGIAGFAITLVSNVTPQMGQGYIVESFLVVVTGGVGKLVGVVASGFGLGMLLKLIEPIDLGFLQIFDATWSKVAVLAIVVAFIQYKPAGLFPDKGRLADYGDGSDTPWLTGAIRSRLPQIIGGIALVLLGLVGVPLLHITGFMSLEMVNKLGQFVAFAIVAIGLDLVWGYMGVLSLCQFLFFAMGGYAMGLYLAHHGPLDGVNNIPRALYVVSSAVGEIELPWFWVPFKWLPVALVLGLLLPGLVALGVGLTGFVARVKGVYFAILTQAVTVAFWLIFQKNDIKLCGTNGLTNFVEIAGVNIATDPAAPWHQQTRFWLYIISVLTLIAVFVVAKWLVHSSFGRVLIAIRDDEARLRFLGYKTWAYKTVAFTLAGMFAAIGGMLYTPQKGIITPEQMTAFSSILVVVWVALGGRGTLWGAVIGAIVVNMLYDRLTSGAPAWYQDMAQSLDVVEFWAVPDGTWLAFLWSANSWPLVLGGLFVLVVLVMPGGIMGLWHQALSARDWVWGRLAGTRAAPPVPGAATPASEVAP